VYAFEDNWLWKRHLVTLLVQAMGVFYVIPVHGGSNQRLSAAAALMSIIGFVKFAERIHVLRISADMNKSWPPHQLACSAAGRRGHSHHPSPNAIG
jgi:hypothetical protein